MCISFFHERCMRLPTPITFFFSVLVSFFSKLIQEIYINCYVLITEIAKTSKKSVLLSTNI